MPNRAIELGETDEPTFCLATMEDSAGIPALLAVGVAGGLILTSLIFWLCCPFPSPGALSWKGLGAWIAVYIIAAIAIYAILLGASYRLFGDQLELPFQEVMCRTWASAPWIPFLTIQEHQHSPWVMAAPIIIAAQITRFLRIVTCRGEEGADPVSVNEHLLFSQGHEPALTRRIRPSLVTSITFQFGVALSVAGQDLLAGMCLAGAAVYPIWKLSREPTDPPGAFNGIRQLLRSPQRMLLPAALTGLSLLPCLKNPAIAEAFTRLLKLEIIKSRPVVVTAPLHRGGFYSGLILLSPAKPIKQLIRPPSEAAKASSIATLRKPQEINFDGVYWYFQPPDERPQFDAPIVHGNPTKNTIYSTDDAPVTMVANQTLDQAIPVRCCRALRVEIVDGEDSLGPINLQIFLKNTDQKGANALSLGKALIPFSAEHHSWIAQHPVDEALTFPFPRNSGLREFNEITIAVKPLNDRVQRGAHIAIQKFTLMP